MGKPDTFETQAAFATLRVKPWAMLGTMFDKPVSTAEMLKGAHLANWNVRLEDTFDYIVTQAMMRDRLLAAGVRSESAIHAMCADLPREATMRKEQNYVVRDNPWIKGQKDILGVVGGKYNVFGNEMLFAFGDSVVGPQRRWEAAGAVGEGSTVFAVLSDTDDIILDPNGSADKIEKFTLFKTTHDGSGSLIAKNIRSRFFCANVLPVALKEGGAEIRIRHTKNLMANVEAAKRALGIFHTADDAFQLAAQAMIETQLSVDEFWKIVQDMNPEPEKDVRGSLAKHTARMDEIMNIWENGTGGVHNLENTAWKGFQVLTEHGQWFYKGRGDGATENALVAGAGLSSALDDSRQDAFQRFYNLTA